jgi:hypothetical protein
MRLIRDINALKGQRLSLSRMILQWLNRQRVIVMQDGKITREDMIGSPLEEDLKMWRYSGLGKKVVSEM